MRALVLLLLLMAGTAAAADEKTLVASTPQPPEIGSGSSLPIKVVEVPTPATRAASPRNVHPDDETRRRLMMLLMMRNAAQAFPSALLRSAE